MGSAIKHGLANLANLSGRDSRSAFWYLVLFAYILSFVISTVASFTMIAQFMPMAFHQAQTATPHPQAAVQGVMMSGVAGWLPILMWVGIGTTVLKITLVGASFVRRLHDSGIPGWVALIPFCLEVVLLIRMPGQMNHAAEVMRQLQASPSLNPMAAAAQQSGSSNGLIGWLVILIVIALALRQSTIGPNRYGDQPEGF
jgi:uncharacterized membrane protein YhaH (DUF805 family)